MKYFKVQTGSLIFSVQHDSLESHGFEESIEELDQACRRANVEQAIIDFHAVDYLNEPEVQALEKLYKVFKMLSLKIKFENISSALSLSLVANRKVGKIFSS